jgi:hypothetical protein
MGRRSRSLVNSNIEIHINLPVSQITMYKTYIDADIIPDQALSTVMPARSAVVTEALFISTSDLLKLRTTYTFNFGHRSSLSHWSDS